MNTPANEERELELIRSARRDADGAGQSSNIKESRAIDEALTLTTARGGLEARTGEPATYPTPNKQVDATDGREELETPQGKEKAGGFVNYGRFPPGTKLADRYRVVELLGKGGMGEVYRVDDLKLGQSGALKFLTLSLASDPARIADMHHEVRIARQVSHPNVCRVYDIGEIEGHPFISMEYIDGENLSSLLKRIGRIPEDKGIDISRQLCAGLAAAHECGVLHRDLKPSNIMIDGRGKVRINDFGLAGFSYELAKSEIRAGTPAYMAPEQFAGKEVSERSDLYSLGLVMYEMFTGRRAFAGQRIDEIARLHERSTPTQPSSVVGDLDPVVERVIMRCLEKDPRHRPPSAIAVAAALPGGDPLAAAIAAGTLPSPEMVAAAGASGAIRPGIATPALVAILVGILLVGWLNPFMYVFGRVPLEKSPDVLADNARALLQSIGHHGKPADAKFGFRQDNEYLDFIAATDDSTRRWDRLAYSPPAALQFWYRESPEPMAARDVAGAITLDDPPATVPGMAVVCLDPAGRLIELRVTAAQIVAAPAHSPDDGTTSALREREPDWSALFRSAGLDLAEYRACPPRFIPAVYCDTIAEFERIESVSTAPASGRDAYPIAPLPNGPLRVRLGAVGATPVYYSAEWPWRALRPDAPSWTGPSQNAIHFARILVTLSSLVGGAILAWRNMRLARGDRRGAFRLALYVFATYVLNWLLLADHVSLPGREWDMFMKGVGRALFYAAWVWILYLAVEPYVRRFWPDSIVAWSRLLAGRFRDPAIGRDLLIGGVLGVGTQLVAFLMQALPGWMGYPASRPLPVFTEGLIDLRHMIGVVAWGQVNAFLEPMFAIIIILLFRVLARSTAAGIAAVVILFTANFLSARNRIGEPAFFIDIVMLAPIVLTYLWVLMRFGLLAMISGYFFLSLLTFYPFTLNFAAFHADSSILVLLVTSGLAVYGYFVALAGRPLIRDEWSPA